MKFNQHDFQVGQAVEGLSQATLRSIASIEAGEFDQVLQTASPLLKTVLNACPLTGLRRYSYIDIRVQALKAGQLPHKPGWHCDTTIQSNFNAGNELHHLFVTGTACLTPFIAQEVDLDYPEGSQPQHALSAMQSELAARYPALQERSVPSCTWVTYGPTDFHRVKPADFDEVRLLIRIRETNLPNHASGFALAKAFDKDALVNTLLAARNVKSDSHGAAILALVTTAIPAIGKYRAYLECLGSAYEKHSPPYGAKWYGDLYRELALDPLWFSVSLLKNALAECDGYRKAKNLAFLFEDSAEDIFGLVEKHAEDELLHATLFMRVHDQCTAETYRNQTIENEIQIYIEESKNYLPHSDAKADAHSLLDFFIQINLGEIRALIQILLLQAVLKSNPRASSESLKYIEKIQMDELFHVAYSAKMIEKLQASNMEIDIQALFDIRANELNDETLKETGGSADGFYFKRINESIIKMDENPEINSANVAISTIS